MHLLHLPPSPAVLRLEVLIEQKLILVLVTKPNKKSTLRVIDSSGLAKDQIGLMKLTAIRYVNNGQLNDFISLYAAIDTGATRSLCSRELGEKLHATFDASDCKEFHLFYDDSVRYEVMTCELDLVKSNCEVVSLGSVDFINHNLPFSQYLPKSDKLPQRVNMILGSEIT